MLTCLGTVEFLLVGSTDLVSLLTCLDVTLLSPGAAGVALLYMPLILQQASPSIVSWQYQRHEVESLNVSPFPASACVLSMNVPLARASSVVKPSEKSGIPSTVRRHCKVAWHKAWVQGREIGLTLLSTMTEWLLLSTVTEWLPYTRVAPGSYKSTMFLL